MIVNNTDLKSNKNNEETEEQRYKLFSQGERKYICLEEGEIQNMYKRPDLTKAQYDMKIKKRIIGTIEDLNFLCDNLPKNRIEKYIPDIQLIDFICLINNVLNVTEMLKPKYPDYEENEGTGYLDLINNEANVKKKKVFDEKNKIFEERKNYIKPHIFNLLNHFFDETDLKALNELINRFKTPADLERHLNIEKLKLDLSDSEIKNLEAFLKHKNILTEYKSKRKELFYERLSEEFENEGIEKEKADKILKNLGKF